MNLKCLKIVFQIYIICDTHFFTTQDFNVHDLIEKEIKLQELCKVIQGNNIK